MGSAQFVSGEPARANIISISVRKDFTIGIDQPGTPYALLAAETRVGVPDRSLEL